MNKCSSPEIGRLLHAYELNHLSQEDVERFEVHLLGCEYCFNELSSFEQAAEIVATDPDVRRVLREAALEETANESAWARLWGYLWPNTNLVLKPAVTYVAILLLVYPAYLGLYKTVSTEDKDAGKVRPVQTLILSPILSTSAVVTSTDKDLLINFAIPGAEPGRSYRVVVCELGDLTSSAFRELWRTQQPVSAICDTISAKDSTDIIFRDDDFRAFDENATGRLLVPSKMLKAGIYHLLIEESDGQHPENRRVYTFEVGEH